MASVFKTYEFWPIMSRLSRGDECLFIKVYSYSYWWSIWCMVTDAFGLYWDVWCLRGCCVSCRRSWMPWHVSIDCWTVWTRWSSWMKSFLSWRRSLVQMSTLSCPWQVKPLLSSLGIRLNVSLSSKAVVSFPLLNAGLLKYSLEWVKS